MRDRSYFHQLRGNPDTVRAGMRWTDEEDTLLIQRAKEGMTLNDIAREHKRTTTGVRYRILAHALATARRDHISLWEAARLFHVPLEDLEAYRRELPSQKAVSVDKENQGPVGKKKDGLDTMISDIRDLLRGMARTQKI